MTLGPVELRAMYVQVKPINHWLHMELDLQSLFGLLCIQLYSLAETPATPPLLPHLGSYTRALLVSQYRRHLFVTSFYN
jgi:hypothetical protein